MTIPSSGAVEAGRGYWRHHSSAYKVRESGRPQVRDGRPMAAKRQRYRTCVNHSSNPQPVPVHANAKVESHAKAAVPFHSQQLQHRVNWARLFAMCNPFGDALSVTLPLKLSSPTACCTCPRSRACYLQLVSDSRDHLQTFSIAESGQVTLPSNLTGTSYAVVSKASANMTDAVNVADPVVFEFY